MKDFASKTLQYSKHIVMIHFQEPDILSFASVNSFYQKYVVENDWTMTLLTDEVDAWYQHFDNINIKQCNTYEQMYKDSIDIEYDDMAVRSDLLRTYYVWRFGGMYADTDIIATRTMPSDFFLKSSKQDHVIFCEEEYSPETGDTRYVTIPNAWFYSPYPRHIFMKLWLEGFMPERSLWRGVRFQKDKEFLLIDSGDEDHIVDYEAYRFEYSLYYPQFLSTIIPSKITKLEPRTWYYPKDIMFYVDPNRSIERYSKYAYGFHLWRSIFYQLDLDHTLTKRRLKDNKNTMLFQLLNTRLLYDD